LVTKFSFDSLHIKQHRMADVKFLILSFVKVSGRQIVKAK